MGANFGRCVAGLTASVPLSSYPVLSWVDAFMHLHLSIKKRQRDKRAPLQIWFGVYNTALLYAKL